MSSDGGRPPGDGSGSEPEAIGRHGTGKPGSPGRYSSIPSSLDGVAAAPSADTAPAGSPASNTTTAAARLPERRSPTTHSGPRPRSTFSIILRLATAPIVLAVAASVILAMVLARTDGSRSLAVNVWLLIIGGLGLWFCWRVLASAFPTHGASAFDTVRDRPVEPPSRLPDVIELESVLLDAEWSWGGVEHRLRPVLRRVASARLLERHQVDIESQPEAARRILGEELWKLVGPGELMPSAPVEESARPTQPKGSDHKRGMPRAQIKRAIELLEAL